MLNFLVLALATWRLASLFVDEAGPADMFLKFRHFAGIRFNEFSTPYAINWVGEMLLCLWCTSLWTGTFLALIHLLLPTLVWQLLAYPLALSAAAILIGKWQETAGITAILDTTDEEME